MAIRIPIIITGRIRSIKEMIITEQMPAVTIIIPTRIMGRIMGARAAMNMVREMLTAMGREITEQAAIPGETARRRN